MARCRSLTPVPRRPLPSFPPQVCKSQIKKKQYQPLPPLPPNSLRVPFSLPQMARVATASPGPGPGHDQETDAAEMPITLVKAFSMLSSLTTLTDDSDLKKTACVAGGVHNDRPALTQLPAHVAVNFLGTPGRSHAETARE